MKITNQKYKDLHLANEEDRGENFSIDFIISSVLAFIIIYATYRNFITTISVYFLVRFLYYFLFELLFRQTPGKFKTQTQVVTRDGKRPRIWQLAIRNISRFISLASGVSDDERAIHDQLSNTFVVKNLELKMLLPKENTLVTRVFLIFDLALRVYGIYYLVMKTELLPAHNFFLGCILVSLFYIVFKILKKARIK